MGQRICPQSEPNSRRVGWVEQRETQPTQPQHVAKSSSKIKSLAIIGKSTMAYSQFTIEKIKTELGYQVIEGFGTFGNLPKVVVSAFLTDLLERFTPLALSIDTEKARSESSTPMYLPTNQMP